MEKPENNLEWQEVKTEHIIRDEWIDFRRSAYRFPDGKIYEPFYSFSRRSYVVIAATDEDGRYICVRQYRHGIRAVTTEFPAGGIERKDGKEYGGQDFAEDALEAAKRELQEETGYVSDEWKHLLTVPSCATIADNYAWVFSAKNCRKVSDQSLDEYEFLNVELHTAGEMETLIHTGKFEQAVHIMAWFLAKEPAEKKTIYLAGGCFWGMQKFFDQFDGVLRTQVGYANGPDKAPTYKQVCSDSGHAETVRIDYDENRISLEELLGYYFMVIDPLSVNRQGNDAGIQYRTGIYYTEEAQLERIRTVYRAEEAKAGAKFAVELEPLKNFFQAEEYHQKYLDKNPGGYCHISESYFHLGKG